MALLTFRDTLKSICPPWLQRGTAEKVLYAIGVHVDGVMDALVAGIKARFPGVYTAESLPLLGRDRRIRRGRTETDAVYTARLQRWLDDHRRRGGPYALLAQLFAHYAPSSFAIELRYVTGRRFQMDTAGNVVRGDVVWTPPGSTSQWARWWLFYDWPTDVAADGIWSDPGTWSDGGVWDYALTPQEVTDLRLVPREWNAAHALGWIVLQMPTLPDVTLAVE